MNVLLAAPNIDGTDVGEAYVAFKWVEALAKLCNLTVASLERPDRTPLALQLPNVRVISWSEPAWARKHERLNAMLKPAFPLFAKHLRQFVQNNPNQFDLAHMLMPQAARYSCPFRHFDTPYVIGPLGGALTTPSEFEPEAGAAPLFTRLRQLDGWRFRNDPWLRASYIKADMILGVAPYMQQILSDIPIKRFEPVLELGIEALAPHVNRVPEPGKLRLLHVGRGVRTKGLRDVVRALGHLKDLPGVTLTSAGDGEEIALAKAEADRLGVADRCRFLGRIPRQDVEALYHENDVFAFPSFREPAGGVLYEAMRWGLPVVTASRGGPEWIIDDSCGIRIPVTNPKQYAVDIADAVRTLHDQPSHRMALGQGARAKVEREGLWHIKAEQLLALYHDIFEQRNAA
ncbi:MAG: glycosyltransferase [Pseudoprimorskyibacter sp.]|nr:glycosyltransferase [Pseudoprimorskyibacter sp.]